MKKRKHLRNDKVQLGQFMTPRPLAARVINNDIQQGENVLEPSFGDGSFIIEMAKVMLPIYNNNLDETFNHIYGVELDTEMYQKCLNNIKNEFGKIPEKHHLYNDDFLLHNFERHLFERILGNPPFGGTISLKHQINLEKIYGNRCEHKIKRETYSYFLVKSVELLMTGGKLSFICSDTFLTIKTMTGLRYFLMNAGNVIIEKVHEFSEETSYGMVVINFTRTNTPADSISVFGEEIKREDIEKTGNFSWGNVNKYLQYFGNKVLSDYIVCSSGMTIGRNELFVREIVNNEISEPYEFHFDKKPITIDEETKLSHLGKLSPSKKDKIEQMEKDGETKEILCWNLKTLPTKIKLPNKNYKFYNKMVSGNIYVEPKYVVFWKDDGKAVKTFKKNGNWYLHGIGGMPFFEREGFTWNLIGSKINPRYLPKEYILDSGCPCGFLKSGIDKNELYFIVGWLLTNISTDILKEVINHTRNIQGKDVEKLPYPIWIDSQTKTKIVNHIKEWINLKKNGKSIPDNYVEILDELFSKK